MVERSRALLICPSHAQGQGFEPPELPSIFQISISQLIFQIFGRGEGARMISIFGEWERHEVDE